MELIVIRAQSERLEDALALRLLFPELTLEGIRERLSSGAPLPEFDLEGNERIASVRRLSALAELLRDRAIEHRVHHLIEPEERSDDPFTEIDLDLLETVLEGRPTGRSRFTDTYRTG